MRRTKIVATLGPATDNPRVLDRLIKAGVDAVRINYSHQTKEEHAERIKLLRERAREQLREIGVIADLQGPKIRLQRFRDGSIVLKAGEEFVIDAALTPAAGDDHQVGVTYKELPGDVSKGDTLLVDDGRLILKVEQVKDSRIECVVILGGPLSDNKGINREGGGLSAKALTHKDRIDLRHAVEIGVDYIAISFPRNAEDITNARKLIEKAGGSCGIIAKIERAEALVNAQEIIDASDGIMIARGDLGVEIGDARLPPEQKRMIKMAHASNRFAVTATQMMDSMISSPMPTRAEVFDVANAVMDGTDAVMLSAETSVGKYPDKAVAAMSRICQGSEDQRDSEENISLDNMNFASIGEAIAMSAVFLAKRFDIKAIAALTESGGTCSWMSRISSHIPIFAFTRHDPTLRRVTLHRGVYPIAFDVTQSEYLEVTKGVLDMLLKRKAVRNGDNVLITKGDLLGKTGGTNLMKIVTVGDFVEHVG